MVLQLQDDKVLHEMVSFLASSEKANWIYGDYMYIFVRKSKWFIGEDSDCSELKDCFDLANINVEEEFHGKGIFSNVLEKLVTEFPHLNIYIESIMNPAVEHICSKFGFVEVNSHPECKNMVRRSQMS